jgi:hypothetical protein
MRNLPLLLVLALLALFAVAGPAQALGVPPGPPAPPGEEAEEGEEEAGEPEPEAEAESSEGEEECEWFVEEGESCAEAVAKAEAEELAEGEECAIEGATATVAADRRGDVVRLSVRYTAYQPSVVAVDARLRGAKGGLRLGASQARFQRAGVFRHSFRLGRKAMARVLAAREFAIDLHAVNTPASCRMRVTAHRDGGRKALWS